MKKTFLLLLLSISFLKSLVLELTDKNFEIKIKESTQTIVMFSAPWCGACRRMKPDYAKLAETFDGKVEFTFINTDEEKVAGKKHEVNNLPTTIVFKNGKEIRRHVGSLDMVEIIELLDPKVEENICNASDAKNVEKCFRIAYLYSYEKWTLDADLKAFKYFTKVCDNGNMDGCLELGYTYFHAKGVDENISRALKLFDKSCKGGKQLGCVSIGIVHRDGNTIPQDYKKATDIFKKACENNSSFGCYHLARSYESGNGIEQNGVKALLLQKEICDSAEGEGYAQYESCNQVGQIYKYAKGVEQNYAEALKYYNMACDKGSSIGCNNLGLMYGNAEGVKKDASRAIKLFTLSCNEEDATGCSNLGSVYRFGWYGVQKSSSNALKFYKKSCLLGDYEACYWLGDMYKNGIGVDINNSKAMTLFKKSCDGGDSDGCDELNTSKSNSEDNENTLTEVEIMRIVLIFMIIFLILYYKQKRVLLENKELKKAEEVPFLFSWTMFIFGFLIPLFRADFIWFVVSLILYIVTGGLATMILAFFYNKMYIKKLLSKGYEPANDESKALLDSKGIRYELSNSSEKLTLKN